MTLKEAIIQRILNLCGERNLSINKLSTVCGMTQSTINNIVNGRNKSTTTSTVYQTFYISTRYITALW